MNRLTAATDPLGGVTGFGYDPNGNLLSVTDARNNPTTYAYNNMDRLETRTDPLLKTESYTYDNNGNPTQFSDRKQQPTSSTYDALDRRTAVTYADGSTTTYTYDAGNRVTQIVDSVSGTITRAYDGLDRLTSETTPQGSVTYTYDAADRRTSMTVFGQPSVVYTYDTADRLIQITQGSSSVTFTYDNADRRTSLTLPNGTLTEYAYDAASRATGITYKQGTNTLGNLTYEYDKAGNRTKIAGSFARTGVPQGVNSTAYNAANHQMTFGDKTLTYDNNGNLTSSVDAAGTTLYTWNARNQLTGISGPGVNVSFVYDGVGRRQKKTINSSLTEFLYDGLNPVQETSGATVLANILTGLGVDEFLARTDVPAGTTSSFLADGLGSALALANAAGTVQTEYTYEPFGRVTVTGAANTNSYQYTGREDDGTGLYYYRARYYHPALQRFISEDPIEFLGRDVNLYAYVANSPANFTDSAGLLADGVVDLISIGYDIYRLAADGRKGLGENLPALGLDLVGLFIPGVTGLGPASRVGRAARRAPDFVVTSKGDVIPVPLGATGPTPVRTGKGFQYTGGSGGQGLDPQVSEVRIMEPTLPRGPSPGYPGGYASYGNVHGQTVNPYTGRTISPSDPAWHIPLKP